jgi:Uma2 family endonuclease
VLINPTLLIEILSESTADFNRDEKFRRYRTHNDTLQDYVLVLQTMPLIEVHSRRPDGWLMAEALGLESSIRLPSIDCRLPLQEVYDRVVFPPEEDEDGSEAAEE